MLFVTGKTRTVGNHIGFAQDSLFFAFTRFAIKLPERQKIFFLKWKKSSVLQSFRDTPESCVQDASKEKRLFALSLYGQMRRCLARSR